MQKNDINAIKLKELFPVFKEKVHGHRFIYLDSASTAQMPQIVVDAMVDYYTKYKSNVGRGIYSFAEQATKQFEDARLKIAQFIHAKSNEIIVVSGATHGINLIIQAWASHIIKKGDEIIVSEIEHNSNFVPWQQFAMRVGALLTIVPVNEQGIVDARTLEQYVSCKTKLIAIVHTSNILGTTNNIAALTQVAHSVGAKILVDAAQSVAHTVINVEELQCDFLVFSGHKLFGPTGIGILFVKESIQGECQIPSFGGGMVCAVLTDKIIFKAAPYSFESGTQPIAQMIGLGAVITFLQNNINFKLLREYETSLVHRLSYGLREFKDIEIISHIPNSLEHSNLVTFVSSTYHAHDIAAFLDQFGIAVRAGHHCVQWYYQKHKINASVRVSFSMYNTEQDVDDFICCLKKLLVNNAK